MTTLNLVRFTILSLLLFSSQAALALPKAFEANFIVSKGSLKLGNLHASLKYSNNKYHYHKSTKSTGLAKLLTGIKIIENSEGQFSGQHIKPINYLFKNSRRSKSRIDKAHFNGSNFTGSYKGTAYKLVIPGNTLDRASLELALARDLSINKLNPVYSVVEKGRIKNYAFTRHGEEKVKTDAGIFSTIKLSVKRKGNKRHTTIWLAKELDYMPVQIHHKEKGDLIKTVIKDYKWR